MKAGDERDINVTFPTEYHAEDLAGKDAVFHVKVKQVQEKQLPDLDDEFVKDISDEYDTLEAYRAGVRERLEKEAADRASNEFDNDLLTKIVDAAEVDIPNSMIERQIDALVRDMERSMSYQGISLEMFMQYTGSTMEQIRDRYRAEAERRVKSQLVLEEIIAKEDIKADDADIEEQIAQLAETSKQDIEELRKKIGEQERDYIREDVAIRKAFDMLRAEAVVTEQEKELGAADESAEKAEASEENAAE